MNAKKRPERALFYAKTLWCYFTMTFAVLTRLDPVL